MQSKNAWEYIKKVDWEECCISFECVCGHAELYIDDQEELVVCPDCGREYSLSMIFTMKETRDG